jgi:DNA-binding NtrC family response regulator
MALPLAVVIDSDPVTREKICTALSAVPCAHVAVSGAEARAVVESRRPDVVIAVGGACDAGAVERLRSLRAACPRAGFLFIATSSSEDLAIAALRAGAQQYLKEPWTDSVLKGALVAMLPAHSVAAPVPDGLTGGERLVGRSDAMQRLRAHLARVAPASSNVLVLGETGTGKEVVAELLHRNGSRSSRPFVCINTAAIPDSLLENELFGHERGAFTGATGNQGGKLAAAHLGTVFLDEIGDVSLTTQAKLLRAIENKSVYRLGGTKSVNLDVRIIAATNSDLERATAEGRFRKDLYYRLNVVNLRLPPLRDRRDDIPVLVAHFLNRIQRTHPAKFSIHDDALRTMVAYDWPGNVRELENAVEHGVTMASGGEIEVGDLPTQLQQQALAGLHAAMHAGKNRETVTSNEIVPLSVKERDAIFDAIRVTNGDKLEAARLLGIGKTTLYRKLKEYGLTDRRQAD